MKNNHGEHCGKDTHADNEYEIFHCTQIRHSLQMYREGASTYIHFYFSNPEHTHIKTHVRTIKELWCYG